MTRRKFEIVKVGRPRLTPAQSDALRSMKSAVAMMEAVFGKDETATALAAAAGRLCPLPAGPCTSARIEAEKHFRPKPKVYVGGRR